MSFNPIYIWMALGLILIIAELMTMSLVLLFFGIAALLVALAKYFGLNHVPLEIFLFAVLGLGSMLLFRAKLLKSLKSSNAKLTDQNAVIVLPHDLPAHGTGNVMYQGVTWTALNESDTDLKKGMKVYIRRTEGVKLIVGPEPVSHT